MQIAHCHEVAEEAGKGRGAEAHVPEARTSRKMPTKQMQVEIRREQNMEPIVKNAVICNIAMPIRSLRHSRATNDMSVINQIAAEIRRHWPFDSSVRPPSPQAALAP